MNENATIKVRTLKAKYENLQEVVGSYGKKPYQIALSFILGFILVIAKYTILPIFLFAVYYIYTEGSGNPTNESSEKDVFDGTISNLYRKEEYQNPHELHPVGDWLVDNDGFVHYSDDD